MRSVVRLALLLLVLAIVFTVPAGADDLGRSRREREKLLELTNQYRAANGRPPLSLSEPLSAAAQNYADAMASQGFFGHDAPDGGTMTTRIERGGYTGWSSIGENLGAGYKSPEQVFEGWLASPTHRENLLNPNYREVGIGYTTKPGSPYVEYWVENFGARPGAFAQSATKPHLVLGFAAFQQAAPELVGDPLEDVWHLGSSGSSTLALQRTTTGILLWVKPLNRMIFVTETEAYGYHDGHIEPLSEAEHQVFGALASRPSPTSADATTSGESDQAMR